MGANIELWQYRLFQNAAFYLDEVFRRSTALASTMPDTDMKDPIMVAAGKKAAATRATGTYTFDEHLHSVPQNIVALVQELRDYIAGLDDAVEESPKKYYVAYKVAQNFVCMEPHQTKVTLFLKLDPSELQSLPDNARDVREIGHYGTGDLELTIKTMSEAEAAKELIRMAFEKVGG
jgi:predicted transport protein